MHSIDKEGTFLYNDFVLVKYLFNVQYNSFSIYLVGIKLRRIRDVILSRKKAAVKRHLKLLTRPKVSLEIVK